MPKGLNLLLLIFLSIPLLAFNLYTFRENYYTYLSHAFIDGSLSLLKFQTVPIDSVYFNGKYYLLHGPFPSVLLMPFVWLFGVNFQESYLKFPLTILNFWLIFKIGNSLKISPKKSLWLAIFFIFGSVYTPIAALPYSTYYLQVVTTSLVLFSIYEFASKRRYPLIGSAIALAVLSRGVSLMGSLFFIIYLLKKPISQINLAKFTLPILISLIIWGGYNWARFGNLFETGYSYQLTNQEFAERKAGGLFSPKLIPTNLYYLLIKTPDPVLDENSHVLKFPFLKFDPYGMSIFFLSPILFLLFKANFKDKMVLTSSSTVLAILIPIVTFSGIGIIQIGYRFALEFFPFLIIPLASASKKVNLLAIQLLVTLGVFTTWFFIIEKLAGF